MNWAGSMFYSEKHDLPGRFIYYILFIRKSKRLSGKRGKGSFGYNLGFFSRTIYCSKGAKDSTQIMHEGLKKEKKGW
jgi:hypothetical protein